MYGFRRSLANTSPPNCSLGTTYNNNYNNLLEVFRPYKKKNFIKPFSIPAPPTSQMRSGNVDHVILQLELCRGKKILALMYHSLSVLALMLSVLNYF